MSEPGWGSRRSTSVAEDRPQVVVESSGVDGAQPRTDGGVDTRTGGQEFFEPVATDAESVTDATGTTVLHVDDDPGVGDLVTHFLEDAVEGLTVLTETDAASALDRAARADVDCVVSDLEMPGQDGLDFARALDETRPDLPVVLFTSRDWGDVEGLAGAETLTAHVTKSGGHHGFERLAEQVETLLA